MRRYGLIGRKLDHSFSKSYFMHKFVNEKIDAMYELYPLEEISDFKNLINSDQRICGLNVTIPYKQSIIPYLDKLSEEVVNIGAVNCIAIRNGVLYGYNTDIEGIAATLNTLNITPNTQALVLGTGGAAQAVCYVLKQRGIGYMSVSRSSNRAEMTYDTLPKQIIESHKLIINTTPLGMFPDIDSAPDIDYSAIGAEHRIFDLVYNPSPTRFMELCRAKGATTIGGSLMLETQAEASWRIWQQ